MKRKIENMTYEEKEERLDEILQRLDRSEIPVDKLSDDAKGAASLIKSMDDTIRKARQELTGVFEELDKMKSE
ncbi:MAG: exodeoxyribonuclease VII small subunit [Chloroflexota bacterium]|nr:exodeoxyribonuclease VII small subunit [Chloroflexota bacterium]